MEGRAPTNDERKSASSFLQPGTGRQVIKARREGNIHQIRWGIAFTAGMNTEAERGRQIVLVGGQRRKINATLKSVKARDRDAQAEEHFPQAQCQSRKAITPNTA